MSRETSARAVVFALLVDVAIAAAKGGVFLITGSAAVLSEAVHSLADVLNQAMLAMGLRSTRRRPDPDFPYGYPKAPFVWALMSAVGVLLLGCGITVYHGIDTVLDPHPLEDLGWAFTVLGIALVLEGASFVNGIRQVRRDAGEQGVGVWAYLQDGPNTLPVAVVLEDGAAVVGVFLALGALGLVRWTGDPVWDGVGSIAIGLLLGASALFLMNRNRELLLGRRPSPEVEQGIRDIVAGDPAVERLLDVKAIQLGPDTVRFKAEVDFDGAALAREWLAEHDVDALWERLRTRDDFEAFLATYSDDLVERLGEVVDRFEARIQEEYPEARHLDFETD